MMKLFLRKEYRLGYDGVKHHYVAYYADEDMKTLKCENHNMSRPDKRFKYTMYNCAKYDIVWLPDMK